MELAGEIECNRQRCKAFKKGDQIFGFTGKRFGAYAEYVVCRKTECACHKTVLWH